MCLIVKDQHEDIREWVRMSQAIPLVHVGTSKIPDDVGAAPLPCAACQRRNTSSAQVAHHTSPQIGASRVYLMDHLSGAHCSCGDVRCCSGEALISTQFCCCLADPPLNGTLADYIADGTVHYTRWQYSHEYYEKKTAAENLPPKWVFANGPAHHHRVMLRNGSAFSAAVLQDT